jgi:hypothetical protein
MASWKKIALASEIAQSVSTQSLDVSGSVSIGTTNSSKKLNIFNGSDGVISNFYGANADGVRLSTYVNDSSGYALIYAYDDNDGGVSDFTKLYIGSNSSGKEIVADGQGRLGIGTTSLSRKFTVVNTTTNTATGYFYTNAVHTGVDTHSVVSIRSDNASSTGDVLHVQGDGTGNLLTLSKDGSDKLTVTHTGDVKIQGSDTAGIIDSLTLVNPRNSGSTGDGTQINFQNTVTSARSAFIKGMSTGTYGQSNVLVFGTSSGVDTPTEKMRIDSSGNVTVNSGSAIQFGDSSYKIIGSTVGNYLRFYTESTQALEIDDTQDATFAGKVAISSAFTNNELLGVKGSVGSDWGARIENTSSIGAGALIKSATTNAGVQLFQVRSVSDNVFTIMGDQKATFSSNVGIGRTPTQKLDIYASSGNQTIMNELGGGGNAELRLKNNAGDRIIRASADKLQFIDNADSRADLTIDGSGNIGIGTTSPDYQLELEKAGGGFLSFKTTDTEIVNNDVLGTIQFGANDATTSGIDIGAKIVATATDNFQSAGSNVDAPTKLEFFTQDNTTTDVMSTVGATLTLGGDDQNAKFVGQEVRIQKDDGQFIIQRTSTTHQAQMWMSGNQAYFGSTNATTVNIKTNNQNALIINTAQQATFTSNVTSNGNILSQGASAPSISVLDTTNNASLQMRALDTEVRFGSTSNHPIKIGTNDSYDVLVLGTDKSATFGSDVIVSELTAGGKSNLHVKAIKTLDSTAYLLGGIESSFSSSAWLSANTTLLGPALTGYGTGVAYLTFSTDGTNKLSTFAGNLGINTDSGGWGLNVKGVDANVFKVLASDGNTLSYLQGTNGDATQRWFADGNATKVLINTNGDSYFTGGNVGIGTATPTVGQLQINASADTILALTKTSGATSGNLGVIRFGNTNVDDNLVNIVAYQDGATNAGGLKFQTQATGAATANALTLGSDKSATFTGDVTVSSATDTKPILKLEQTGNNVNGGQFIFLTSGTANDNDLSGVIRFKGMNDAGTPEEIEYATIYSKNTDVSDGSEDGELHFRTMSAGSLDSRLTLNSSNVGIGTTSPTTKLTVLGSMDDNIIKFGAGSAQNIAFGVTNDRDATRVDFFLATEYGTESWTKRVTVTNQGKVGIGTTSPSTKLEVSSGGADVTTIKASYNSTNYLEFSHNKINAVSSGGDDKILFQTAGTTRLTLSNTTATFSGDVRLPNSGKLYLWNDNSSNYLSYNNWQASSSSGMTIKNTSGLGSIILKSGNSTALTLDSSQTATFTGNIKPSSDSTISLGTDSVRFLDIYTDGLDLRGDVYSILNLNSAHTYSLNRNWRITTNNFGSGSWGGISIDQSTAVGGTSFVQKFGIDINGNVGIGTTSPSTMLHLKSSTSTKPKITIEDTNEDDNMGALQFIKDSASPGTGDKLMQIWAYGDNDFAEQILYSEIATLPTSVADGSEEGSMRFRVMNAGSFGETMRIRGDKVGIGTTSPAVQFHVKSSTANNFRIERSGTTNAAIHFKNASEDWYAGITSAENFSISRNADIAAGTDFVIRGNTGRVGIGTSNPDTNLHIYKASAGSVTTNTNSQFTIENSSHASMQFLSPNSANSIIYFGDVDDNDVGYINYVHSSNTMNFQTNTAVRLSIEDSGNVNIGSLSKTNNVGSSARGLTIGNATAPVLSLWDTTNAGYHSHFFQVENNAFLRSSGNLTIQTNAGTVALTVDSNQITNITPSSNTGVSFDNASNNIEQYFRANSVDSIAKIKVSESAGGGVIGLWSKNTSGTQVERLNIDTSGYATFSGSINTQDITAYNMITIESADISSGENNGLRLINTSGTDHYWHITNGQTGVSNENFTIRDGTNNRDVLVLTSAGNATFAGDITVSKSGNAFLNLTSTGGGARIKLTGQANETTNGLLFYENSDIRAQLNYNHSTDKMEFRTYNSGNIGATLALTIDGDQNATFEGNIEGVYIETFSHNFTDDLGTSNVYIPWQGTGENTSMDVATTAFLTPFAMELVSFRIRPETISNSGTINVQFYKQANGSTTRTDIGMADTGTLSTNNVSVLLASAFDILPTVSANEKVGFKFLPSTDLGGEIDWYVTTVWKVTKLI